VDPFAPTEVRKVERTLIVDHRAVIGRALDALTPANADTVRELAESGDMVRGYEVVKLRNVTGSPAEVDELEPGAEPRRGPRLPSVVPAEYHSR